MNTARLDLWSSEESFRESMEEVLHFLQLSPLKEISEQ